MSGKPDDRMWTFVRQVETGVEWPFTMQGHVLHRRDLSDLEEPYLSAVKETLAARAKNPDSS